MVTTKNVGPPPPIPPSVWEPPERDDAGDAKSGGDGAIRPDESFHDDRVGAHIESDKAAHAKLIADRFAQEAPRRVLAAPERVAEAGAFGPAQEDEQARRANREGRNRPGHGRQRRGSRRDVRTIARGADTTAQAAEERVAKLWTELEAIAAAADADPPEDGRHENADAQGQAHDHENTDADRDVDANEDDSRPIRANTGGKCHRSPQTCEQQARLNARHQRLERAAKYQLQQLVAGGIGFVMAADPRQSFARLFDLLDAWPRGVPPGRRPQSDADFDAFLQYIFAPPTPEPGVGLDW